MEKEMKMEPQAETCEGTCECSGNKANYEQLVNVTNQLYVQNQELSKRLNELEMDDFFKRLDWLWRVITSDTPYLSESFKRECGQELMKLMTKPEETEESPVNNTPQVSE